MKARSSTKLRLTEGSDAVKSLRPKFHCGTFPGNYSPKDVWNSDVLYKQYELDRFRARWNRLKKEYNASNITCKFYISYASALLYFKLTVLCESRQKL